MVQAENKKLAEPLKKAKEELHRLKGMLGNHEKDKNALITTKAKLKVISKELEELRWEHEVLQQKYNQVGQRVHIEYMCTVHKTGFAGGQGEGGDPGAL